MVVVDSGTAGKSTCKNVITSTLKSVKNAKKNWANIAYMDVEYVCVFIGQTSMESGNSTTLVEPRIILLSEWTKAQYTLGPMSNEVQSFNTYYQAQDNYPKTRTHVS
jgi:hypothetical protein